MDPTGHATQCNKDAFKQSYDEAIATGLTEAEARNYARNAVVKELKTTNLNYDDATAKSIARNTEKDFINQSDNTSQNKPQSPVTDTQIAYSDNQSTNRAQVNIPKSVERQIKKLSPEAQKSYEKAIEALTNGDLRGLNNHALGGNRSGQRAVDIKGIGKGRGQGRIIYEIGSDGRINLIKVTDRHEY